VFHTEEGTQYHIRDPLGVNHLISESFLFDMNRRLSQGEVSPLPETGEPLETDQKQKGPRSQSIEIERETVYSLYPHLELEVTYGITNWTTSMTWDKGLCWIET